MRLEIRRCDEYSRGKWRLVNDAGETMTMPEVVTLSSGSVTTALEPVCGETKAECVDRALQFAGMLVDRVLGLLREKEGGR